MSAPVLDQAPVIDDALKDLPEAAFRMRACKHNACKKQIPCYVGSFCSDECSAAYAQKRKDNAVIRTACCRVCLKRTYAKEKGDTPPQFCSNKCRKNASRLRQKGVSFPLVGRCLFCDIRVEGKEKADAPPSYCSGSCRKQAAALRSAGQPMPVFPDDYTHPIEDQKPAEGNCFNCDGRTVAAGGGKMAPHYCSTICKKIHKAHKIKSQTHSQCINCEQTFSRDYEDSVNFCSGSCRRAHQQSIKEKWEAENARDIRHCSDYRHKVRHLTAFHAYAAIDRYCDESLRAYSCSTCGAYHIGHPRGYELEFVSRPATYSLFQAYQKANVVLVSLTKRFMN